ncbi:DNA-binding CsgD family transcriptional regulator [Catenulispora sp. GAS73]|uniref:helix-turn-helix transcriptional regulator n=1 Tax=Catenulispora sp. GAS73 TaxID=3156269 RepID=UPI003517324C
MAAVPAAGVALTAYLWETPAGRFFSDEDAGFVAEVAPVLATRLRNGLHPRFTDGDAALVGDPVDDPVDDPAEPGTIILDEELSVVGTTGAAWRWIERLGLARPGEIEPLPTVVYSVATRAALSRAQGAEPPTSARVCLQAADGQWTVVRAAPLVGAAGGYVLTLEAARPQDVAPLLMQALSFTAREREVATLVIDGLSSEDIARALFISVYTVRDHVKAILAKAGVSRRHDLIAVLAGNTQSR